MKEKTKVVGVRFQATYVKLLEAEAANYGCSVSEYVRALTIRALTNADRVRLFKEIAELKEEISATRQDLGIATLALLADAGKASAAEAEEFVKTNLGR